MSSDGASPKPEPVAEAPREYRFWIAFLACLVPALAWNLIPWPAAWIEAAYSKGLYRGLSRWLVPLADSAPFSLAFWGLAAAVPILVWAAARAWRRNRRRGRSRSRTAVHLILLAAAGLLVIDLAFVLSWGAGYRRLPLETRLGLPGGAAEPTEALRVVEKLAAIIKNDCPAEGSRDGARALEALRLSLQSLIESWDGLPVELPRRLKHPPRGWFLAFGTTGMITPFTLEPHVDPGLPEAAMLATGVHELAHVAGLNGEAEAEFAGAAAGLRATDGYARYAVALSCFQRFSRELPAPESARLFAALPPEARRDIEESRSASRRYRVRILEKLQAPVYDAYLKSQGIPHGIRDYSRALQLLIQADRAGKLSWP